MIEDYSQLAIEKATKATLAYCKFITANDVGATGGHQSGFHIHKTSWSILFETEGRRGENKDRRVKIKWQDDFETDSRFIYYGVGTRDEYRITNFGRDFPFLKDDLIGSLLVLCKLDSEYYAAYVLQTENEIDSFLEHFGISPLEANGIVKKLAVSAGDLATLIQAGIEQFGGSFPETAKLAEAAQVIYGRLAGTNVDLALSNPDEAISHWVDTEYRLFKELEKVVYRSYLESSFATVENLVEAANTILNRRKSRAGKSLEHHLAKIFDAHGLPYSAQPITEGRNKPDFIIPGIEAYRNTAYSEDKLVFLGAKTTCKDRWRQVLEEAVRIPKKHLFTLQPGVSSNQLKEMSDKRVTLVIPEANLAYFSRNPENVMTLKDFILFSKAKIA